MACKNFFHLIFHCANIFFVLPPPPPISFLMVRPLLIIISTHKIVVSRNFLSIRVVLSCFICSFSVLKDSHLESDVCSYGWHFMISSISFVRKLDHVYYGECRTMYRPGIGRYIARYVGRESVNTRLRLYGKISRQWKSTLTSKEDIKQVCSS